MAIRHYYTMLSTCVFKPFGTVLRIYFKYDGDCLSNQCYVTFTSDIPARDAFETIDSLSDLIAEIIRSRNVVSENYYYHDVFDDAEESSPRFRHVPTPVPSS